MNWARIRTNFWPIFSSAVLLFLFCFAIYKLLHQTRELVDRVIAYDIARLETIFRDIQAKCDIIDFEYEKNYIDFLNVIKFVGSQLGPMNLMHPERWPGAYLNEKLTVQQKPYAVLETKNGYYIVPGDGVKLSNGTVIGKDIVLSRDSDIENLIERGVLKIGDFVLAAKLPTKGAYTKAQA